MTCRDMYATLLWQQACQLLQSRCFPLLYRSPAIALGSHTPWLLIAGADRRAPAEVKKHVSLLRYSLKIPLGACQSRLLEHQLCLTAS